MSDDQHRFLALLGRVPARLNSEQAAWLLNCQTYDIPVLVAARLLKPLRNPMANSVKYFAAEELLEMTKDSLWLSKITNTLRNHWRRRNGGKALLNMGKSEKQVPFEETNSDL
jgi:hypothetical protein